MVGVYASASDPVHVPSLDSRSSAAIGAIKQEVGVVGVFRQSLDNTFKQSSRPNSSNSSSILRGSSVMESFQPVSTVSDRSCLLKMSQQVPDRDNYANMVLVNESSPYFTGSESQQWQDPPELSSFSVTIVSKQDDPQIGYDIPYFIPSTDDDVRGQGLPSPQEALTSEAPNSFPVSATAMTQQQPPVGHVYQQVHISHFADVMPYRQFVSSASIPLIGLLGHSSNSAYLHPSNGNGYVLVPRGGSHLTANGVKFGILQLKPVPAGSPIGFGNLVAQLGMQLICLAATVVAAAAVGKLALRILPVSSIKMAIFTFQIYRFSYAAASFVVDPHPSCPAWLKLPKFGVKARETFWECGRHHTTT
ncbi:hypothetical protein Nepgr_017875 [Nepenthes gracilis]|uniref:Uncharacterized protein n=1 Tax=Nepenthes gracilis TaxID=150966 RepID=A0AAD3XTI9_NEPGR|nr:hypothetical protein Nepgr_017875 [Nepenthes gracilis]